MNPNTAKETYGSLPQPAEDDGNIPQESESDGTVPNISEPFRTTQNSSEDFRNEPNELERTLSHTLTVRETARLFERAGVPRTERSIVNWCQPNRQGKEKLDCYFDPNERKYFITPGSVEAAIKEERSKENRTLDQAVPKDAESKVGKSEGPAASENEEEREREIRNLKITNLVKDQLIERLEKQNDLAFAELKNAQYRLGRLEERLQLTAPDRLEEFSGAFESNEQIITSRSPEGRDQDLDLRNGGEELPR